MYLTEVLRHIAKANGVSIMMTYNDILKSAKYEETSRSSEDIINSIKQKADAIRG